MHQATAAIPSECTATENSKAAQLSVNRRNEPGRLLAPATTVFKSQVQG